MKQKISLVVGTVLLILFGVLCGGNSVCASGSSISFYHTHTGNAESGGGCYGKKVSSSRECGSYSLDIWDNGQGSYNYLCKSCGNQWVYIYELQGAHCTATITETHYETNCGMGSSALATLSCAKSTEGWSRELDLLASCQVYHNSFQLSATPYIWNGTASASGSYHVTQNGTYTLGIQASGADTSQSISVVVDHIDNQAPVIKSFAASGDWSQSVSLQVQAEDIASGLATEAYSYDGGVSWTSESCRGVAENGTYSVIVRDAVGNQTSAQTTVTTIDKVPPEVHIITSPAVTDWYEGDLMITLQAMDTQSGLADAPYSFDGGSSFLVGNSYRISGSSDVKIVVADRAGNRAEMVFSAQKQVRPAKVPEPTRVPAPTEVPEPTRVPAPTEVPEQEKIPESTQMLNQSEISQAENVSEKHAESVAVSEQTGYTELFGTPTQEDLAEETENIPILGQHYPKETWQGTPIRGNGGLKERSEEETQTVVLNELLSEGTSTDVHIVEREKQNVNKKWTVVLAGMLALICLILVMLARIVIVIYAKDAKGHFRMVGITTCHKKDGKKKVVITDAMLRRAQTNLFRICMPILASVCQDGKMVVGCHCVEREIMQERIIQIRLRSE